MNYPAEGPGPLRWHQRNHDRHEALFACFRCQAARAVCRSKLRFGTREGVDAAVRAINEGTAFVSPLMRYRCRWCLAWHMTRPRRPEQFKRVEKARRKWLGRLTG